MAATATECKEQATASWCDGSSTRRAFRVWAPERKEIEVVFVEPNGREQRTHSAEPR